MMGGIAVQIETSLLVSRSYVHEVVLRSHSELKYDNSRPTALIGFARLERFEVIPKLTRRFRIRPSHISDMSCKHLWISKETVRAKEYLPQW